MGLRLCQFIVMTIDFSEVNYADLILDIGKAILIFIVTVVWGRHFTEKISIIKKNNKNLSDYGIISVGTHGKAVLSDKDICNLFGIHKKKKPYEVCFFFLTGYNFFDKYLYSHIATLAKSSTKVKILVGNVSNYKYLKAEKEFLKSDYPIDKSNPLTVFNSLKDKENDPLFKEKSEYYTNIAIGNDPGSCFLDRTTAMLISKKDVKYDYNVDITKGQHAKENINARIDGSMSRAKDGSNGELAIEVIRLKECVQRINQSNGNRNIEIRFYDDEYRVPLLISKYHTGEKTKSNKETKPKKFTLFRKIFKTNNSPKKREKEDVTEKYLVWTNMVAPMQNARSSISVYSEGTDCIDEIDCFAPRAVESFDYVWNKYEKTSFK